MTNEQKLVMDWMQKFGQECPEKPGIPSMAVRWLRAKLILEEALEVIEALGFPSNLTPEDILADGFAQQPNLEAIADGCADLKVVTIGTEVACGIDGEHTFKEVMRSNDSKLWTFNELLAHEDEINKKGYTKKLTQHFSNPWLPADRVWLVKDKDGKAIKSPSYSPANLKPLLTINQE